MTALSRWGCLLMIVLAACAAERTTLVVRQGDRSPSVDAPTSTPWTTTPTTSTTSTTSTTTPTTTLTLPDPAGPRIRNVAVGELEVQLALSFDADAGDATILGGSLYLTLDGAPFELRFPADLTTWSGGVATVLLDRPTVGQCALAADHQLTLELLDIDALSSGVVGAQRATTDQGLVLSEVADAVALVGNLNPGDRICGDLDAISNDGTDYLGDHDFVGFDVPSTGAAAIRLDWDAVADFDLYLLDASGTEIDRAIDGSMLGPEEVGAVLTRGEHYVVQIVGWDGIPGDWTLERL